VLEFDHCQQKGEWAGLEKSARVAYVAMHDDRMRRKITKLIFNTRRSRRGFAARLRRAAQFELAVRAKRTAILH
jgi:hypothetical protein